MKNYNILAINPGSTSTKIAVYHNEECHFVKNIVHSNEELAGFKNIPDQFQFRKDLILNELKNSDIDINSINVIVGRGGMLKPIPSGVYEVNDLMKKDLASVEVTQHASNLGGLIASEIAQSIPNAKAYIADPVVVDEMDDIARYSGHPDFHRVSIFHALNQKAIARQHAKNVMKKYEEMNIIVVHMGGGVSVGAHHNGRVIDVNQALDGEGPFSPERSGTLPCGELVKMCFSGKYTQDEVMKKIIGKGGMVAFLGTNSAYASELKAKEGDEKSKKVLEAFAYQVAKYVGSMSPVLHGEVDAIILTGGIAHSKWITSMISERVYKIAPVYTYPGEDEMRALAYNGLLVAREELKPTEYK